MLLPILHLFNDGYLAAMPLILPFASEEFGFSMSIVGFLGSLLSFSGIILAIPAGAAAAKAGTLRILRLAVIVYSLGFLILGISTGVATVILSFILGSIAFGIFHPVAFSAVAKSSESSNIGKAMGLFAATGDIGRIAFAAAITFVIGLTTWRTASISYGVISAVLFLFCLFSSRKETESIGTPEKEKKKADFSILKNSTFSLANISSTLDAFANASLFIFLPFLLAFRGIDKTFIGPFTALYFVGNLSGKVIMGRLTDRIMQEKLFIGCELCIALSLVFLSISPSILLISILALILGFFTKGTVPITSTMIAESVSRNEFEAAYSINSLCTSVANTVAPLLFGIIADILGIQMIFFICASIALLAAISSFILLNRKISASKTINPLL